jgi:hypothetical protein
LAAISRRPPIYGRTPPDRATSLMPGKMALSGLPLLIDKLRAGGLDWLSERLVEEWRLPRTAAGQAFFRRVRAIGRAIAPAPEHEYAAAGSSETLYAFYDLGVAPVSFDFLWFLVGAELERQRNQLKRVHVVIVPGPHAGLRRENAELETGITPQVRRARVNTMLVPTCALLPSVTGVTVASTREQAGELVKLAAGAVFPPRYEPAFPRYPGPQEPLRAAREEGARVGVLRATPVDLAAVDHWLAAHGCGSRVVTITLRSYSYVPARNSNLSAWTDFARRLDAARFSAVFIPDSAQWFKIGIAGLEDFPVFREAALLPGLRMALYHRAYLNLGVNNGPMGLCWLNDQTRYITFKMLSEAAAQTTPEYMRFLGFEIGKSLPFATACQQWVWEDDELPVLERAFAAMVERLEPGSQNRRSSNSVTSSDSAPLAGLDHSISG